MQNAQMTGQIRSVLKRFNDMNSNKNKVRKVISETVNSSGEENDET